MSYRNYIIQDNVSIENIQQALGEGSKDLYTLCRSNNINKWAKFKPVRRTFGPILGQTPLINTTNQWDSNTKTWSLQSTWWQADNGMCGLIVPMFSNLYDLINSYIGVNSQNESWQWGHDRLPEYSSSSGQLRKLYISRIRDFYGYNSNARPPIHDFMSSKDVYFSYGAQQDDYAEISVGFNVQSFLNGASLSLQDLVKFAGNNRYYFGVVLVKGDILRNQNVNTYHGCITTSKYISESGFLPSVKIPIGTSNGIPTGDTFHAFGFISEEKTNGYITSSTAALGDIFSIGLPYYKFSTVKDSEWLGLKITSASSYDQDEVTVTVRLFTWRTTNGGNADLNHVYVYGVRVEGKFGSSSPAQASIIDDARVGEPVSELYTTNNIPISIPCRSNTSVGPESIELTFKLDNRTDGTGRMIHPLRYVVATAWLFHGGDGNTQNTWSNTAATKETDYARYTLSSGNI